MRCRVRGVPAKFPSSERMIDTKRERFADDIMRQTLILASGEPVPTLLIARVRSQLSDV
jgi:hypothetical protein